jgi:hypothetical protein
MPSNANALNVSELYTEKTVYVILHLYIAMILKKN